MMVNDSLVMSMVWRGGMDGGCLRLLLYSEKYGWFIELGLVGGGGGIDVAMGELVEVLRLIRNAVVISRCFWSCCMYSWLLGLSLV